MRTMNVSSFFRRVLSDQRGQVLPWVTLMLFSLLGMAGLTVDVGRAYVVKSQLQSSSNAAVLSAANNIYYTATGTNDSATESAKSLATQFSAGTDTPGNLNTIPALGSVSVDVTTPCLSSLLPGTNCADTGNVPNAVRIVQTAKIPTYFMRVFGFKELTISATATASYGVPQPWNVAIILDSTPSMATNDPYCKNGGSTAEQCAMNGIQSLLKAINPCRNGKTDCPSSGTDSIFRVALFSFPNVSTTEAANDWCSGSATPKAQMYSFPIKPDGTYATAGYGGAPLKQGQITYKAGSTSTPTTYLITQHNADPAAIDDNGFTSDAFKPSGTNGLNPNSKLVKIVGNGVANGCMKEPGSFPGGVSNATYFAGAIYAAQAALQAENDHVKASLGINAKNAIIFISDGQAQADAAMFPPSTDTITSGNGLVALTKTGIYPDATQQCQQTIMAARYAITNGTRFYGVGYGVESTGCTTESKIVIPAGTTLNVPITGYKQVLPCVVMENVASMIEGSTTNQTYFYSEGSSAASGCSTSGKTTSSLSDIFGAITATLTSPKLLPNNAS